MVENRADLDAYDALQDARLSTILGFHAIATTEIRILTDAIDRLHLSKHFAATVVQHEMYHFFQSVGTSFGIQRWARCYHRIASVQKAIQAASQNGSRIHIPFRSWPDATDNKTVAEVAAKNRAFQSQCDLQDAKFAGSPSHSSENLPKKLWSLVSGIGVPKGTLHPILDFGDQKPVHLGCTAVLEGTAWLLQRDGLMLFLGEDSREVNILDQAFPQVYKVGSRLAAGFLQERFTKVLYFAISDLALWAPIGGPYENPERYVWEDVHPGWRLYRILKLLSSEAVEIPSDIQLLEYDCYVSFISSICGHLNWETPQELAQRCVAATRGMEMPNIIDQIHVAACELRLEHPLDLFLPYASFEAQNRVLRACPPLMVWVKDYTALPETWSQLLSTVEASDASHRIRRTMAPIILGSLLINELHTSCELECPVMFCEECPLPRQECLSKRHVKALPTECPTRKQLESILGPLHEIDFMD